MTSKTFTEETARAPSRQHRPHYYPIYLDLQGRRCVVIGTGHEVERKVQGLLEAGAEVVVVWPAPSPGLEALAESGGIALVRRPYREGDLAGAFLAIAATTADRPLSERIATEARGEGVLLNVMDVTDLCGWIAPALVRRGALTVAISTSGLSPAMARFVKERIATLLPQEYGMLLEVLAEVRQELRERHLRPRSQRWQEALDAETLRLVASHEWEGVRARLLGILLAPVAKARPSGPPVES